VRFWYPTSLERRIWPYVILTRHAEQKVTEESLTAKKEGGAAIWRRAIAL
jgi:hypothetical protein